MKTKLNSVQAVGSQTSKIAAETIGEVSLESGERKVYLSNPDLWIVVGILLSNLAALTWSV